MGDLSLNWQLAVALQVLPTPQLNTPSVLSNTLYPTGYLKNLLLSNRNLSSSNGSPLSSFGVGVATDYLSKIAGDKLFGDSEFGRGLGTLFSSGISSAGNSMINNLFKELTLMSGLGLNVGSSLAGAGAGIVSNYIGKGINALGGDSKLSRGIGQGISSGLGTVGGTMLSNLVSNGNIIGNASKLFGTGDSILTTAKTIKDTAGNVATKAAGAINPYALGATVLGTALGAAMGPSKEYGGDYGGVTKTADTVYDMASLGVNFIPGVGQALSGAMALNKGLSNIFGSTSGNTLVDSILGSAFMPAPVKWLNLIGKTTSRSVGNLSWQNTERKNAFMGNAFGNIENRILEGIKHSNSTQGLFSSGATRKFNQEVDFANMATNKLLAMMDLHDLLNIKSLYMSSINNLRYAQDIQGGWNPIYRGKQGMKIFNNQINHNIGLRLLSGAALIDNKAMILSAQNGTKFLYDPDWSDKLEPYAAGLGLAGDAAGIGASITGIGVPVGAAIASFANIPNLIIDGYQTVRDAVRSYNDNGLSLGSAAWNSGELLLDTTGLKILSFINKAKKAGVSSSKILTTGEKKANSYYRVGTGVGRRLAQQSSLRKFKYNEGRRQALEESNSYLAKRGIREAQGEYYRLKLADEMAKRGYGIAVNDAIKSANRTIRQNLAGISTISAGINIYHLNK